MKNENRVDKSRSLFCVERLDFDRIKKEVKDPEPGRQQKARPVDTSQPSILWLDYVHALALLSKAM